MKVFIYLERTITNQQNADSIKSKISQQRALPGVEQNTSYDNSNNNQATKA